MEVPRPRPTQIQSPPLPQPPPRLPVPPRLSTSCAFLSRLVGRGKQPSLYRCVASVASDGNAPVLGLLLPLIRLVQPLARPACRTVPRGNEDRLNPLPNHKPNAPKLIGCNTKLQLCHTPMPRQPSPLCLSISKGRSPQRPPLVQIHHEAPEAPAFFSISVCPL